MRILLLLAAGLTMAGCQNPNAGYSDYNDPGPAAFLAGMGLGLLSYQPAAPPRPTITNCSTFGQRGMGMSCTSY